MKLSPWERVLERLDVGLCWEFTGSTRNGYGTLSVDGRQVYVHRLVWEFLVGPVPEGLEIDHLCRNRRCCNPDHLEPVTHAENQRRAWPGAHLATRTRCTHGHEFTVENTIIEKRGTRQCRECANRRKRAWNSKRPSRREGRKS